MRGKCSVLLDLLEVNSMESFIDSCFYWNVDKETIEIGLFEQIQMP